MLRSFRKCRQTRNSRWTLGLSLLLCGLGLLGTASAAPTANPLAAQIVSPDLQLRRLAADVWMHTSWADHDGQRVPSNGLLVLRPEGLLLIDTSWDADSTAELLVWAQQQFGRTVDLAVSTHSHTDRVGGLAALDAAGIPAYASPRTLEHLAQRPAFRGLRALPDSKRLLKNQPVRFSGVEVVYPGVGHSDDNLAIWIEDHGILFGGCAVKSASATTLGNLADADQSAWPHAIRALQARYGSAQIVVPGHGEPGSTELLKRTLELLGGSP